MCSNMDPIPCSLENTVLTNISKIKVSHLQKEKDDLEANCRQILETLEAERIESKAQISKLHSEKKDLNKRLIEEQQTTSSFRTVIGNHIKIIERISSEQPFKRLSDENDQLKKKIESLQKENLSLKSTLSLERKRLEQEINLTEDLMKAVQEKNDLTIRLKLASASLTHNNSNIADLSNPNRLTKLAEAFSELYDNEWTNAFENLKEDDERITVKSLLTMLQKAHEFSVSLSEQATVDIKGASTQIVFSIKKHQPERVNSGLVRGSSTCEPNSTCDLQPTEKQLISDIRRRVLNDIKDQIISMISNAVVAEMNLHACENSIFTYVKACATICWNMRIHQPPVCLEFVEVGDQRPFNTATYKQYTKSGHRMDYVVWPALYLHDGGALLSKGVAQGH